jgi:hypothetical protein
MSTQLDIARLVNEQIQKTLAEHLAGVDLKALVQQSIAAAVDGAVQKLSARAVEQLVRSRDMASEISTIVGNEARKHAESEAKLIAKATVAGLDVAGIVSRKVADTLKINIKDLAFPEGSIDHKSIRWNGMQLSGDIISGGIIKEFNSTGIQDISSDCQLTISDGMVVVEGKVLSKDMQADSVLVDKLKAADIEVQNITITEGIRDAAKDIAKQEIESAERHNINLKDRSIVNGEKLLLDSSNLGPSVTNSNLRKVGALADLRVLGESRFADTMYIGELGRVGVNTDDPSGAFTVWDDNAELSIKKQSNKNMFIGSTRDSDLTLGTNNKANIKITQEEVSVITALRIMGVKFSITDTVPERSGEPGEIVMNKNAKSRQPLFYMCQGNNTWTALGITA